MPRRKRSAHREEELLGQWGYFVNAIELVYSLYDNGHITVRKVSRRKTPAAHRILLVSSEYRVWGADGEQWPTPDWKWGQIPDSVED